MKLINKLNSLVIVLLLMTGLVTAQSKSGKAVLSGRLIGFSSIVEVEDFTEIQLMVPNSYNRVIQMAPDSTFKITIPLQKPTYFRVGRNKLYLSPGDNMEVVLNYDRASLATFKGKGSAANNYLVNATFPKGGSYLEAGRNLKKTPEETKQYILEEANRRMRKLDSLKGVSAEFIKLETVRIKADIIMSLKTVKSYLGLALPKESREFHRTYDSVLKVITKPIVDSIFKNFVNPSYLQVEVYRDIYDQLPIDNNVQPAYLQEMRDWKKSFDLAFKKIKTVTNKSDLPAYKKMADSIQTKKYRDILYLLIADKMKFGAGDPAIDVQVRVDNGTNTTLSSLKGKVIYIDIWATWCGPCLAEMPYLEELKKKYEGNNQVAIVSLSVDDNDPIWLKNLENRKPGGIQWRIDRPKLVDYGIEAIPRYILIDKNFKIAELTALKPSDPSIIKLIDALLKK